MKKILIGLAVVTALFSCEKESLPAIEQCPTVTDIIILKEGRVTEYKYVLSDGSITETKYARDMNNDEVVGNIGDLYCK